MTDGLLGLWERIEALREEDVPHVLQELGQVISTPLPQLLRPEFVRDACSFLHHEKDKPLLDKLRFLTTREVFENEVICALRILAKDDAELCNLPALTEIKRACRHVRVDMVESAMQFFESKVIAKQSFTNKVMFLTREQQVERQEIEEALDRLGEVFTAAPITSPSAPITSPSAPPVAAITTPATTTPVVATTTTPVVATTTTPAVATTTTPVAVAADPRSKLDQALAFLSTVANLAQGQQFLLKQGYSPQDAEEAVQVKRVCDFINQPSPNAATPAPPLEAKVRFLLGKGVAKSHVDTALKVLGKSSNPKVQRAIDFLSSAQTHSLPQADKTAFLQKQGLTEAEIAQALALVGKRPIAAGGIKLNPTNATPPPPAKFAPSLLEMSQTLLLKLAPKDNDQYQAERAAFLAVLLFHERDVVLRLVRDRNAPVANRGWSHQLQEYISQWSKQRVTTSSEAEFDWLKQTSRLAATHPEYLDLLEGLSLDKSTDKESGDDNALVQIEVDFLLSRALHWGFACQLSVQKLDSLPRSAVCVAALLRGFTDFGSGLANKMIQQQLKSKLNLSENTNGVSLVYAGENWIELDTCWEHICTLLFVGCIPAAFDEEHASTLVRSTAFRLTSTIASILTKVAKNQRGALNSRVIHLGEKLFDAVRGNEYIATQLAKRIVLVEEQGPEIANLIRTYQTIYLVFVVLVEFAVDLDNPLPQWNLISHFAFARVQSDEAVRLVDLLNLVVTGNEKQSLEELCAQVADTYLPSLFLSKDFVLGAKIDYLLQTGSRFLKWDVDPSSKPFAKWLLFGCGHEFGYLARDCNVFMTDAIRTACGSDCAPPPALQFAVVPKYMQVLAEADGLDAQVLGFSVGSVFTSLGSSVSPQAPSLACLAYFKLMDRAETRHVLNFMALKAVALPSLSLCLDRVEEWLNQKSFQAMQLGEDVRPINESLYGVISRIEDAPRRGLLMVWFLSHVNDWNAVAKL
ncbi:hypothetical protein BASA81_004468 [Batrachochytrium salamandrivorans]|nr:hypothetical protein BASA81_004468 [Batrachochytrium salamandrivorans]